MKKTIITIILTFGIAFSNAMPKAITLKGEIKNLSNEEVVLLDANYKEIKRVNGADDSFLMQTSVNISDGRMYYLYIPSLGDLGPSMNIPLQPLFIDNNNIEVESEIKDDNLQEMIVKNSPTMDEYLKLHEINPYTKKISALSIQYNEAFKQYNSIEQTEENLNQLKLISDSVSSAYESYSEEFVKMIPNNSRSNALMCIVYYSCPIDSSTAIKEILNSFDSELVQNNYYAKILQEKLQIIKGTEEGSVAPDFELSDKDGNLIKLSSLRGKYVLLDFWASWCGPCRKELPKIKNISFDYKYKNLAVVGVSIDKEKDKWLEAVNKEELDYLQLWDPDGFTSKAYNYKGIPYIVLLDPEGKIIAKQLRGNEIRNKLNEYINPTPFEVAVKLANPYKGRVYLTCIKDVLTKVDSLDINGDTFSFKRNIQKADQYRIMTRPYLFDINICAEPNGHYQVNVTEDSKYNIITENKEQSIMNEFLNRIEPVDESITTLSANHMRLMEKSEDQEAEKILEQLEMEMAKRLNIELSTVRKYPKSFASIIIANNILSDKYNILDEVYQMIDTINYSNSYYFHSFKNKYVNSAEKWLQDKLAPDFTTKDIHGNEVKLSDYRGKYILLDFWASWCVPCRKKMRELKAVYSTLQEKGIEIFSVSLDEKYNQWVTASEKDGVTWINTCDLEPIKENKIAQKYKVSNVPTLFLINPEGFIIKQNPTIEEMLK